MHKNALEAARAAAAAHQQGKFWEFHDKIFADQRNLNAEAYTKYARELGLDVKRFQKDMANLDGLAMKRVDKDRAEANSLGVSGTPAFFVNGRFLSGAKPFEEFAKLIDAELARLK